MWLLILADIYFMAVFLKSFHVVIILTTTVLIDPIFSSVYGLKEVEQCRVSHIYSK